MYHSFFFFLRDLRCFIIRTMTFERSRLSALSLSLWRVHIESIDRPETGRETENRGGSNHNLTCQLGDVSLLARAAPPCVNFCFSPFSYYAKHYNSNKKNIINSRVFFFFFLFQRLPRGTRSSNFEIQRLRIRLIR